MVGSSSSCFCWLVVCNWSAFVVSFPMYRMMTTAVTILSSSSSSSSSSSAFGCCGTNNVPRRRREKKLRDGSRIPHAWLFRSPSTRLDSTRLFFCFSLFCGCVLFATTKFNRPLLCVCVCVSCVCVTHTHKALFYVSSFFRMYVLCFAAASCVFTKGSRWRLQPSCRVLLYGRSPLATRSITFVSGNQLTKKKEIMLMDHHHNWSKFYVTSKMNLTIF